MDVRCERCRAQYVFDDEQVTPSGLTVQCTNCGHVFKVKKKELVVTVALKPDEVEGVPMPATAAAPKAAGQGEARPAPAAPAPEPERREWRVRQANGNVFTFRELTTLQKWIVEQKVSRDDEISQASDHQWKRLGNIAELASFFQVVEAAERSRAQPVAPALTPVPAPVPPAGPAPVARAYPPPPSGFPPPSFAAPPPPALRPRAEATARRAAPEPEIDVDLGAEDLAAVKRSGGARLGLAVLVLAVAAGAAVWFLRPAFLGLGRATPQPIAVPLTFEVRPTPDPAPPAAEPAPPAAAAPAEVAPPVPAPEPVVETVTPQSPEPLVRPEPPAPAAKPAPKGPKSLLAQATKLREKGDPARALDLYGRVVAADPENVDALVGRGLCYLDLTQYAPAEASLQAALRAEPGNADALLGLAETYRWQEKRGEAITYYERYLAEHPDGDEAAVARNALDELRR